MLLSEGGVFSTKEDFLVGLLKAVPAWLQTLWPFSQRFPWLGKCWGLCWWEEDKKRPEIPGVGGWAGEDGDREGAVTRLHKHRE